MANRAAPLNRGAQLTHFAGIGGLGFLVDAGLLTLLVAATPLGPHWSRAFSFAAAVSLTWWLNRHWVFEASRAAASEYGRYLVVQFVGAAINLAVYAVLIVAMPVLGRWPVLPLACGAAVALLFNFLASRRFVFAVPAASSSADTSRGTYGGRENLEAMAEAKNYNNYLLDLVLRHGSKGRVVDFGAGTGTFAGPIAAAGFDLLCVEPDAGLRSELESKGLSVVADIAEVPAGSVDFIYSLNVLEHIERDEEALLECGRCLRPGRKLLLYVPAFQVLFSAMDRKVGHFRRYRRGDLVRKLQAAGFCVESIRYADSLGFIASLVYKWLGNSSGTLGSRSVAIYDSIVFPVSLVSDHVLGRFFGKNLVAVATRACR